MSSSPAVAISPPVRNVSAGHQDRAARSERKKNGAFYTPLALARVLAEWALEFQPKRILEPSFGDGVFLRASIETMEKAGIGNPGSRLFGVEINPVAAREAQEPGLGLRGDHMRIGDLLSLDAKELGGRFGAILGNPPYIRHHRLDEELMERGRTSARTLGIELNGRSDAWAYFCAHLTSFLAEDGRLALVLPGSLLHADYAEPLLSALGSGRGETQLIRIRKRIFPGVQERTVVLLVDRRAATGTALIPRQLADIAALRRALRAQRKARAIRVPESQGTPAANPTRSRLHDTHLPWRLSQKEAALYEEVCAQHGVHELGDLVTVRIGVVTGANEFFVRNADEISHLGEQVASLPIVARGGWLRAPHWRAADQRNAEDKPSRLLLINSMATPTGLLEEEIHRAENFGLHERHHCSKREPWYSITDTQIPQLFLPYMGSHPPRLVVNDARSICTNTIHRLWKKDTAKTSIRAIAAGSWTTLYALSAELFGRGYGGGVLKLEPGGVGKINLALPGSSELLSTITHAFERGGIQTAREVADQELLVRGLGLDAKDIACLRRATERLYDLRRQ